MTRPDTRIIDIELSVCQTGLYENAVSASASYCRLIVEPGWGEQKIIPGMNIEFAANALHDRASIGPRTTTIARDIGQRPSLKV